MQSRQTGFDYLGDVVTAHLARLSNMPVNFSLCRRHEVYLRTHGSFFHIARQYRRSPYL